MPTDLADSICPKGTDCMPPLIISEL